MNKYLCCLLTTCALTTGAQSKTNLVGGIRFSGQPPPPPITRTPESTIFRRAAWRIEDRADSRFVHPLLLDLYLGDLENDPQELFARRGESLFGDGAVYALREWGLETPVYRWIDERLFSRVGEWYSSFWRDTLSGNEERNNVQSPAEFSFLVERNRFSGFKKGLRVGKSPYLYFGHGWRDAQGDILWENTVRLRFRHLTEPSIAFLTEVPLPVDDWSLGFGIEWRDGGDRHREWTRSGRLFRETDRPFDFTVGVKGHFCKGVFTAGADVLEQRAVIFWRKPR